jgi:hypothetical protein
VTMKNTNSINITSIIGTNEISWGGGEGRLSCCPI